MKQFSLMHIIILPKSDAGMEGLSELEKKEQSPISL